MLGSLFQPSHVKQARKCEGQIERLTLICGSAVVDGLRRAQKQVAPSSIMLQQPSLVYFKAATKAICIHFGQDNAFRLAQDVQTMNERLGGRFSDADMSELERLLDVGTADFKAGRVTPLARAVWSGASIGNFIREGYGIRTAQGYVYATYVCGLPNMGAESHEQYVADLDQIMRAKAAG